MRIDGTAQAHGIMILGGSALIVRVFALLVIDRPDACSASWMSSLLGGALSLPVLLAVRNGRDKNPSSNENLAKSASGRTACVLLAVPAVYDAAVSARLFAALVGFAALNDHSVTALSLPLLGVATVVCLMGTGALSASAVIWRWAALALGALVIILQRGEMRPGWLLPIFGAGVPSIARGALGSAGCVSMAALGMLLLSGDNMKRLPGAIACSTGLCAAAVLLFGMLIPAMPLAPDGRLFRVELLLECGRNGLAAEMIFVLMMYGGMLLTGFELMTASRALSLAIPGLSLTVCVALCGALAAALALTGLSAEHAATRAVSWYYPVALACAALMMFAGRRRKAA